jgi:hypothetical protein
VSGVVGGVVGAGAGSTLTEGGSVVGDDADVVGVVAAGVVVVAGCVSASRR